MLDLEGVPTLALSCIVPGRNPRTQFDETRLHELADSIRKHGVLEPILVRPQRNSVQFEIIAGERRFRAAQLAGLVRIPALITRRTTDRTAAEVSLSENLDREDLDPIDEAAGFLSLIEEHGWKKGEVAERFRIGNLSARLSLLDLAVPVQFAVRRGEMARGHGYMLASLPAAEQIIHAKTVKARGLSVAQLGAILNPSGKRTGGGKVAPPHLAVMEMLRTRANAGSEIAAEILADDDPWLTLAEWIRARL